MCYIRLLTSKYVPLKLGISSPLSTYSPDYPRIS